MHFHDLDVDCVVQPPPWFVPAFVAPAGRPMPPAAPAPCCRLSRPSGPAPDLPLLGAMAVTAVPSWFPHRAWPCCSVSTWLPRLRGHSTPWHPFPAGEGAWLSGRQCAGSGPTHGHPRAARGQPVTVTGLAVLPQLLRDPFCSLPAFLSVGSVCAVPCEPRVFIFFSGCSWVCIAALPPAPLMAPAP